MKKPIEKPKTKSNRWILIAIGLPVLFLGLVLFSPGCDSKGDLSGTVLFDGETLTSGSVLLVATDQKPRTTFIEKDGSYKFTNVPTGEAKLAVYANKSRRNLRLAASLEKALANGSVQISGVNLKGLRIVLADGGGETKPPVELPARANEPDQSGLHFDIKAGPNTYDLEVK